MKNRLDTDINYIIHMSIKGDKKYQEILLNRLRPLICKNIYRYWNSTDTMFEDLMQEGYIVVLEALQNFDESKNAHFLAYVKSKIKYFYMNYYKDTVKQTRHLDYMEKIENDPISEVSESIDNNILKNEEITILTGCIDKLTKEDQQLICSYYYDESSMNDISMNLNISYRAALNRKTRIIKRLKKCVIRR